MKWNTIRTKMIVFILLPTLICIMATMFISYHFSTQSLRTRAVDENTNLLFQGTRNIESLIQEINRLSLIVYSDSEFYRSLGAGYEDMLANARIYSSLNYISSSMPDISQVYFQSYNHSTCSEVVHSQGGAVSAYELEPCQNVRQTNTRSCSFLVLLCIS